MVNYTATWTHHVHEQTHSLEEQNRLQAQGKTINSNNSLQPTALFRPFVYIFLGIFILSALLYGVTQHEQSPQVVVQIFTTRFLGILIEAIPFLLMGSLVSGLIEVFVRQDDLVRWLPKNRVVATISGAFLGMIFPVCECGVVPVARRLYTKGLPISVGISFLLAAPFMNPIVFASTYIAFGFGTIFIGRFLITALVAISVGLIFAFTARPEDTLQPASIDSYTPLGAAPKRPTGRWYDAARVLTVASNEFFEMGRYLIIGCLLAAGMQTFVPQETLTAVGAGPLISVLAMQILAFILSVCSTVDSFLALAFVTTFTTGSILAFLSFGPMVDIKSTMMFMGVFKRRVVLYLVLLPFLMNLVIGTVINLVMGYGG